MLAGVFGVFGVFAEDVLKPGHTFRDCDVCPEMVVIPQGTGMIGVHPKQKGFPAELPWQEMTVDYGLAVGKFELLNEEYQACIQSGGCERPTRYAAPPFKKFPAIFLRWIDAKAYVDWLAKKTGKPYRLLTEREWEYAARAGEESAFWWGDELEDDRAICRGCLTSLGVTRGEIREGRNVFQFALDGVKYPFPWRHENVVSANSFGLFHTAGNASEWVEDCLLPEECSAYSASVEGPKSQMPARVIRGNDFDDRKRMVRLSRRTGYSGNQVPTRELGTRIALEVTTEN